MSNSTPLSPIVSLLFGSGPFAVVLAVRAFIVDSVDTVAFRSIAHIGVKDGEIHPLRAYCNAPTAVVGIGFVSRVKDSLFHFLPACVGAVSVHPMLPGSVANRGATALAATTKGKPVDTSSGDNFSSSALTLTKVVGMLSTVLDIFNNLPHIARSYTGYGIVSRTGYGSIYWTGYGL
jgi:hypothetical protein